MMSAQNQNQAKEETTVSTQNGPAFVDKNNNGICDHFENGTPEIRMPTGNNVSSTVVVGERAGEPISVTEEEGVAVFS